MRTGSFTAAAAELGLAQQSVSEQVRLLERACGVALFIRVGRGLRPTEAAGALAPHAERALAASEQAVAAARAVRDIVAGTVRLGVFGTMRYYVGADLVASSLKRYPDLRVQIVGQNSAATIELIRSGDVEAGIVALPVDDAQLAVRPVFRDEILYVSADRSRLTGPVTAEQLAKARLVLPYASWAEADTTRRALAARVQATGVALRPVADVDDVETALDIAGRGLADTVANRGLLQGLAGSVLAVALLVVGKEVALPSILGHLHSTPDVHALAFSLNAIALLGAGLLLGAAGSGLTLRRFLQV